MINRLYDIETAQMLLGGISRTTLFELMRTGHLRSLKVGRRRMIRESDLADFIEQQLRKEESADD